MTTFEIGEDIDVIVAQLDALVEEGKLDEATALANAALAQHPGDVDLVAAAAEVAIEQERFDDAIALIAQVEGGTPQVEGDEDGEAEGDDLDDETRAGLLSLKAHALFYRGDLDEARRTFNHSLRLDAEDWTALLGRALVHERMGFRVAALLDLDHAVAIDDQEAPPFVQRGRVYLHRGQFAEAVRDFGYALESDPFEEEASLQFARLQALQGDAGAAIEALERLVEHGEDDDKVAAGALLRSQLSLTLGSTQAALEDAAITIARWPSAPWGYLQRAACQLAGMDADGAIKSLKEAEKFVKDARDAIATFERVKKRQEFIGEADGVLIFDDFGHHPTAVEVTLHALREQFEGRKLWAIFEAKSNTSRRRVFQADYPRALSQADEVILARSWEKQDGLKPEELLDLGQLVADIQALGPHTQVIPEVDDIVAYVAAHARPGDVVVGMSGSAFDGLHRKLLAALQARQR